MCYKHVTNVTFFSGGTQIPRTQAQPSQADALGPGWTASSAVGPPFGVPATDVVPRSHPGKTPKSSEEAARPARRRPT